MRTEFFFEEDSIVVVEIDENINEAIGYVESIVEERDSYVGVADYDEPSSEDELDDPEFPF